MVAGGLATLGLVGTTMLPASATTVLTCTGNSGSATFTPGITNTPTQQTIAATSALTGCSPGVTGGTLSVTGLLTQATGTPPKQATCTGLATPTPNGTLIASGGAATIVWSSGPNSTGSVKLKSNGSVAQSKVIIKITGGQFFVPGHTTKLKGTVTYSIPVGQTCPTLTMVNTANVGNTTIATI
jgi:hypothetical protein